MPRNLLKELSPAELKREITERVAQETRSLPHNAKVFAAVAQIQGFDALPDLVSPAELQELIDKGQPELLRGLTAQKGIAARVFAEDLLMGSMYPGTLSAIGTGIHFAIPSGEEEENNPAFPRKSVVAWDFARGEFGGVLVRATIDKARGVNCLELLELNREYKARARKSGIEDVGALAASLGKEAFYVEHHYDHTAEDVWVVLNRGALTFQNTILLTKPI